MVRIFYFLINLLRKWTMYGFWSYSIFVQVPCLSRHQGRKKNLGDEKKICSFRVVGIFNGENSLFFYIFFSRKNNWILTKISRSREGNLAEFCAFSPVFMSTKKKKKNWMFASKLQTNFRSCIVYLCQWFKGEGDIYIYILWSIFFRFVLSPNYFNTRRDKKPSANFRVVFTFNAKICVFFFFFLIRKNHGALDLKTLIPNRPSIASICYSRSDYNLFVNSKLIQMMMMTPLVLLSTVR